jgi:monovalent cation/hydrogen antiporter
VPAVEVVLGLLVAVAVLALVARRLHVPYPIVLVIGGLALGLVPGLPAVRLAPEVVFLVFLPPLVYAAGWFTSVRDFKANLRPVGLLSIGLVLATTVGIAVVAHTLVPSLPWAAAFALGAIVSPTDAVASSAIFARLGAPRRIVAILEGESLVNDATGLIAYRYAVAAVVAGGFSLWEAGMQFVLSGVGGVAIGLALAWLLGQLQRRLEDPVIEITLSFLVPYGIYLAAEQAHVSGVLAVAVAGIYAGWRSPETFSATTRVQALAVWGTMLFVLNGLVFVLIGLQLPGILSGLAGRSPAQLLAYAAVVSLAVIAIRFLWVFPATYLPRFLSRRLRRRDPYPGWRNVVVVAWTGMRGVVSLAAALSLPLAVAGGGPFPGRDLILFLTFSVILATLVVQGLSLPPLMRWLGVGDDGGAARQEEADARVQAIEAALGRLDELALEDWTRDDGVDYMRYYYGKRRRVVDAQFGRVDHEHPEDGHQHEPGRDHAEQHRERLDGMNRLKQEMLSAERAMVIRLRNRGSIGDEVMRRIERDLDLEEVRLASS